MEFTKTVSRHIYIDITVNERLLDEVYLHQIDYKSDKSFRTNDIVFAQPLPTESVDDEGNLIVIPAEDTDLRAQFFEKILELKRDGIETHFFAVNAKEVMLFLIEPLKNSDPKAKRIFNEIASEAMPYEWLTDCMSMLRTIPMTDFDETEEMTGEIRKRLKAKYHEVAGFVKKEKNTHIFVKYEKPVSGPELSFCVTDKDVNIIEDIRLHGRIDDDIMVSKASDLIRKYPESDVITNRTSIRLYQLFNKTAEFVGNSATTVIFSMESMLTAIGKKNSDGDVKTYRDYVKNAEDIRFGRYEDTRIYSLHTFRLPVSYNSDAAWNKNFKKNSMWMMTEENGAEYTLIGEKNEKSSKAYSKISGKFSVEKDKERFALRVSKVKIKKYYEGYAVITIEAENRFYPGQRDMDRINELFSNLWVSKTYGDSYPDKLELLMRSGEKIYSLCAEHRSDDNMLPWLAILTDMGRNRKNSGSSKFELASLSDRLFSVCDRGDMKRAENLNEEAINKALVKSEFLLQLEMYLAEVIAPKGNAGFGGLTGTQRKQVKKIAGALAYMVGSYTYAEENGEAADTYKYVNKVRKIRETEDRLSRKLDLLYE